MSAERLVEALENFIEAKIEDSRSDDITDAIWVIRARQELVEVVQNG